MVSPDAIDTHWSEKTLLSIRPGTVQLGSYQSSFSQFVQNWQKWHYCIQRN